MSKVNFEIADLHIAVSFPSGTYFQVPPDFIKAFARSTLSENNSIQACYVTEGFPDYSAYHKIFDCEEFWSVYELDNHYLIKTTYELSPWGILFDQDCRQICYYAVPHMLEDGSRIFFHPIVHPLNQVLFFSLLARNGGGLIHSAGLKVNGKTFIFAGKSGSGKSTISQLLASFKNYEILSDERIAIRKIQETFIAYGTPWAGTAQIAQNAGAPLDGIFFLSHAPSNRISDLTPQKALERLFPVISIPWYDKEIVPNMLDFCEDLLTHVPSYDLQFKPDQDVVSLFETTAGF